MKKVLLVAFAAALSAPTFAAYVFEVNGVTNPDTYILVYQNSFNPGNALANLMDGDDDFSGAFSFLGGSGQGFASSKIGAGETSNYSGGTGLNLVSGTQYYAVTTGFDNSSFGSYNAALGNGVNATAFWSGDTTGKPTFNRPVSYTSLSGVGTAVPYDVQAFFIAQNGDVKLGVIPEPASMIALGAGLVALARRRRK
ncbi:MAG: PEP-CTERM sorting domain-containing protein [Armatimonadetes bacterium]|nr:PEP-CTERM sorting domain-containing protein [Armatimonadota bacterium]